MSTGNGEKFLIDSNHAGDGDNGDNSICKVMLNLRTANVVWGLLCGQDAGVLAFTFTLTSDELGDTFDGVDLSRFAMQQMVGHQESHFTIRPPKPGVYQLVIYVKVVLCVF